MEASHLSSLLPDSRCPLHVLSMSVPWGLKYLLWKKIEFSKQAQVTWIPHIGIMKHYQGPILLVFRTETRINKELWGIRIVLLGVGNSWTATIQTRVKEFAKNIFINQECKSDVQKWSDTVIFLPMMMTIGDVTEVFWWPNGTILENQSLWVPGRIWLQSYNLSELTEGYHQDWNL